jgi:hypothetical protein
MTVAPVAKFVPLMVIAVPPSVVPALGAIAVMTGADPEGPVGLEHEAAATNRTIDARIRV